MRNSSTHPGATWLLPLSPTDLPAGIAWSCPFKLGDNQYTSDQKPQVSLLVSNTWGTLGALAAFSYSKRDTLEQGYSTVTGTRVPPPT